MTTHDIDGDWLDAALEEAGHEHRAAYVADDGFTARVIGRLPAVPTLPAWRRPVIVLLWLLAGAAAMVSLPGAFDDAFRGSVALLLGHRMGLADFALLLLLCGAAAWTSLVYAARAN
ncbi:MAG TPA: hypothetical protein VGP14_09525 [Casimicrobiaceae bacterium]|jgi:hypothetical protein|nr:hypothetical protein [Casimicrobiaceae bacterium]